jgi:glycerophosphoryl diester phosphodiesterase
MVDEQYMAWANESGYKVNVWTVDDPQEAQRLIDLGVAGIITNKPQFMRQQLNL